jgi:20S proteasome alpha/beta subunit
LTLVIAAHGKDFLVAGADSKGTAEAGGVRVELNMVQKLVKVNEHVVILLYGNVERAQYLIDELGVQNRFAADSGVRHVAKEFKTLCREEARVPMGLPMSEESGFGFIVAGLEATDGVFNTPKIYGFGNVGGYSLGLGRDGFLIKGKPMIAYYNFAKNYKAVLKMADPKTELAKLVAQSLHDTIQVDGDVGGPIKLSIIDSTGARVLEEPDVIRYFIHDPWLNR